MTASISSKFAAISAAQLNCAMRFRAQVRVHTQAEAIAHVAEWVRGYIAVR